MSREELQAEMRDGVKFWGCEENALLIGVMGMQRVEDVTLIRHAYVRTCGQRQGVGGELLAYLRKLVQPPVLIGTWADALWAIRFYERHGFRVVAPEQKNKLLKQYWNVPNGQAAASVVLADATWQNVI